MASRGWLTRFASLCAVTAVVLLVGGCQGAASTLDPQGPRATEDARLWWIMFGMGTVVYVLVLGVLFYAIFRGRRPAVNQQSEVIDGNLLIIGGGILIPLLVLPIIWGITLQSMAEVAEPPSPPTLTIDVIGHMWWYEVRYPESGITLTGEMRIPAGEIIQVRVGTADVIHSFWIPRLMGKIDMIPGRMNQNWFAASQPGTYLVECAEFCGLQHATMQMEVVAMPPAEFAAWLSSQRR